MSKEGLGIPHEKAILVGAKLTSVDCNGGWRQRTHLLLTERDTTVQFPILTFFNSSRDFLKNLEIFVLIFEV